jgi:hypothetical protein
MKKKDKKKMTDSLILGIYKSELMLRNLHVVRVVRVVVRLTVFD